MGIVRVWKQIKMTRKQSQFLIIELTLSILPIMEPHGQARACTPKCLPSPKRFVQAGVSARRRGSSNPYPPTPLGAEALRCASAKALVGHPPISEIRRSTVDPSPKESLSEVTHSSTARDRVSCVGGRTFDPSSGQGLSRTLRVAPERSLLPSPQGRGLGADE
jgi:hypothetical protein